MSKETTITRRAGLALGLSAAALPWLRAEAAPLQYPLHPVEIVPRVWTIYGAPEPITRANGGAIANITVLDTSDGAVLIDAGPSHRYGTALKALAERLTGKPVVRVYLTHIHADHVLGATAFEPGTVSGGPALRGDLKRAGTDLTNGMYRVAGDWMRGTGVPEPGRVAEAGVETIGERRFRILPLAGHTREDLCLFEESSGLLFPGDLVFLDRAATTPDADPERWRGALATLSEIDHHLLIPGHGPVEAGRRGIDQTRRWLDTVEARIDEGFSRGLDVTELMAEPLPDWTAGLAVARYEFARSVMHLLPALERRDLPRCTQA
ncbi:MAG TPA: quinoprotein relay system zinc metallohydrolase 1 [Methylobacterium sp.]|uniref:quinoprotein relay system zinc metallohydrolase 1 n=1 Tax=Methylorubrum sp. B1-46 TaxID=2897334 RepID=UPI001E3328EC|nr:quinoprotein relay system zinc metallohydrolase 1 [Methylorubrum sp. B1-46]UGB27217.1 quinoprotein relay system zinc metallohydrolase 1 [Methylorubrum sp. B1-46]HEV2541974.1 quinoprotein relay system zinc metallohydrolase 1 [Methylobacterium sp.]